MPPARDLRVYRQFLPLLRPYRGQLMLAFLATLARPLLNGARLWLLKILIHCVVGQRDAGVLLAVCGAYLAIAVARGLASFGDDYLGGWVGARVVLDLRQRRRRSLHASSHATTCPTPTRTTHCHHSTCIRGSSLAFMERP